MLEGYSGPTAALLEESSCPTAALVEGRGEMAVREAREWVGTPVRWEASLKGKGTDCRGLVAGVARELGFPEGDAFAANVAGYARLIDEAFLIASLDEIFERAGPDEPLVMGDILAFRIKGKVQHIGIWTGERFIHAYMSDPAQVVEVPLGTFWRNRLAGAWHWREQR